MSPNRKEGAANTLRPWRVLNDCGEFSNPVVRGVVRHLHRSRSRCRRYVSWQWKHLKPRWESGDRSFICFLACGLAAPSNSFWLPAAGPSPASTSPALFTPSAGVQPPLARANLKRRHLCQISRAFRGSCIGSGRSRSSFSAGYEGRRGCNAVSYKVSVGFRSTATPNARKLPPNQATSSWFFKVAVDN